MADQKDVDGELEPGARVEPIDLNDLRELDPEAFAATEFGAAQSAVKLDLGDHRGAETAD